MKPQAPLAVTLVAICLVELRIISGQQRELAGLRSEQQQMTAQSSSASKAPPPVGQMSANESNISSSGLAATPELLQLRNQATRLEQRRRELAPVAAQNASLRAQLASRGSNGGAGTRLPPGYVRISEAQFAGYGSPAATLQSFLWAMRNRDSARVLQALSPEMAQKFPGGENMERAFDEASNSIVGMGIVESHQLEDGSVRAKIQMGAEGMAQSAVFRQTNGEWKIFEAFNEADE